MSQNRYTCTKIHMWHFLSVCYMYSMYVFYVCMYSVHVLYACILCIPCMYVVHEWTGRTEPFQNYFFFGAISIYFFSKWTEFSGNSVHLDPGQTGVECTQFFGNSVHLDIGWACRRQIPAASTNWYVQLNGISWELRAFRTRLARVQMNRISRGFHSFGSKKM